MADATSIPNKSSKSIKPTLETGGINSYTDTVSTVKIQSLIDANVTLTGTVTGNSYHFPRAGTVVEVDVKDKDEILNKKRGRACCGTRQALFQLVSE